MHTQKLLSDKPVGGASACAGLINTMSSNGVVEAYNGQEYSMDVIGNYGLYGMFSYYKGPTGSVSFPQLKSIGDYGLNSAFIECTGLMRVSFPQLTTVGNGGLTSAFLNCKNIKELHFRKDAQKVIQNLPQYNTKFGATNATIYFDL